MRLYEDWEEYCYELMRTNKALFILCSVLLTDFVKSRRDYIRIPKPRPVDLNIQITNEEHQRLKELAGDAGIEEYIKSLIRQTL